MSEQVSCAECHRKVSAGAWRWALVAGNSVLYFHGPDCLLVWLKRKIAERVPKSMVS